MSFLKTLFSSPKPPKLTLPPPVIQEPAKEIAADEQSRRRRGRQSLATTARGFGTGEIVTPGLKTTLG